MKLKHAVLPLILAGATLGLGGCSGERQQAAPAVETVRHISIFTARPASVPDRMEAVGTVASARTSSLSSQMMGTILEIRVREGERVRRGQVLAVIDDVQPRAALDRAIAGEAATEQQVAAADSGLSLAESTLRRYQTLYERKSVSPQEFDEIKARRQSALSGRDMARAEQAQAQAAVAQARASLANARIQAPFDGVVTEKKADPGTVASPGVPIFTVEDVSRYRLEVTINENDLRYLREGQPVTVTIDAFGDREQGGRVAQIVPAADAASRSFVVKIELGADPRLRSGLFGRAQFSRGERQSLLIPRAAVIARGQMQGIFVLDQENVAGLRYVSVGKPSGGNVEVLSGLQSGERLVANPGEVDLNGKRIEAGQ